MVQVEAFDVFLCLFNLDDKGSFPTELRMEFIKKENRGKTVGFNFST